MVRPRKRRSACWSCARSLPPDRIRLACVTSGSKWGLWRQNVLPTDPTLDEVRAALAPIIARNAAFDGWSKAAVEMAASQAGVDPVIAPAFDGGAMAMIDAWFAHIDTEMIAACPSETLDAMKIRQKITSLVEARLAAMEAPDRNRSVGALSILAMPQIWRAAQLNRRAADHMWRAAGDTSVDYNYYTKRSIPRWHLCR